MPNIRVFPPSRGGRPSISVNGRSYSAALGTFIDAPDFDATLMAANKWTRAPGYVGPTSARPAAPNKDDAFTDTTLGIVIVFDGSVWRNPITGGAV